MWKSHDELRLRDEYRFSLTVGLGLVVGTVLGADVFLVRASGFLERSSGFFVGASGPLEGCSVAGVAEGGRRDW